VEAEKVFPIGNSPTFLSFADMQRAMPIFLNMSMTVFKDKEAKNVSQLCFASF